MDFLKTLLDFLFNELRPFRVIRSYERAIRFTARGKPSLLGPGFWWRLPWVWEIEEGSVVEQVIRVDSQDITTKDKVPVSLSTNLRYEITDFLLFYTAVHDGGNSLENEVRTHVHAKVREMTFEELLENPGELERASKRRPLQRTAESWGVKIVGLEMSSLVNAPMYRLIGNGVAW